MAVPHVDTEALDPLVASWVRAMRARNLAPKTIRAYADSATQLLDHAAATAKVDDLTKIGKQHIEAFLADVAARWKPATVSVRYRALQQLFRWLVDNDEIDSDPMQRMGRPIVPEEPVEVLDLDSARRLLTSCNGKTFADRRDLAIIRLFFDTGMRLAEMTGLQADDLDLDLNVAIVLGKGRRPRSCPYGVKTATAIDRYLRARRRHAREGESALWLGAKSRAPMTDSGVAKMVRRRGRAIGIASLHPHQFRHTFAHEWLSDGGQRRGPHAPRRLARPGHAQPVRRLQSRQPRPRGFRSRSPGDKSPGRMSDASGIHDPVAIEIRSAIVFDDVRTMVGPKRPDANVC